jgi:hypothetical protein
MLGGKKNPKITSRKDAKDAKFGKKIFPLRAWCFGAMNFVEVFLLKI